MNSTEYSESCLAAIEATIAGHESSFDGPHAARVICVTSRELPLEPRVCQAIANTLERFALPFSQTLYISLDALNPRNAQHMIETIAPEALLILDLPAAKQLAQTYGFTPAVGVRIETPLRSLLVLADFPASLDDPERKREAWAQLQPLKTWR